MCQVKLKVSGVRASWLRCADGSLTLKEASVPPETRTSAHRSVRICDIHFQSFRSEIKVQNGSRIGDASDHWDRGGFRDCWGSYHHISNAFFAYVAARSKLRFGLPKAIRWEGRGHHR